MIKLFHYVHCPFCIRVRMALGFLNITYTSSVLPYNDELTPIKLSGKKMLPILQLENNKNMNESLDIIKKIDKEDLLKTFQLSASNEFANVESLLNLMGEDIHSLCMPHWIYTAEFDEESRKYFQKKKELKRGPFKDLVKRQQEFLDRLSPHLKSIETNLIPYYKNPQLTILDILIASHLWGLYIVPEFQFSPAVHNYLQQVKINCKFNYQEDLWK